jgi:hypothetical protein
MPLRIIVARTLAKDPAERPTARELLDLLLAGAPPETYPAPPPVEPRRPASRLKRLSVAALAIVVAFAGGLVGYRLLPGSDADIPLSVSPPRSPAPVSSEALGDPGATSDSPSARSPEPASRPASSPARQPTRTAPATSSTSANTSGRNLALSGRATASSTEGSGAARQASYAIDGDLATRWSSGFSDPQWLKVDLGARWQISEIGLNWENAHATAYRVELSTDGTTWKSVYRTTNGQAGEVTVDVAKLPARFVRMYGTKRSTDYGYSLLELEVR